MTILNFSKIVGFRGDVLFPYVRDSLWRYYYLGKEYLCGELSNIIFRDLDIMIKRMDRFIEYVDDEDFKDDYFDIPLYKKLLPNMVQLAYDECFGFVPLWH